MRSAWNRSSGVPWSLHEPQGDVSKQRKITRNVAIDLIRGALIAAPTRDDPVVKIPLYTQAQALRLQQRYAWLCETMHGQASCAWHLCACVGLDRSKRCTALRDRKKNSSQPYACHNTPVITPRTISLGWSAHALFSSHGAHACGKARHTNNGHSVSLPAPRFHEFLFFCFHVSHHAAPRTETPMEIPMPTSAQA
jgi:hypothetical protein